jgi:N-acylneuraminate cytidylyltransferase
MRLAIIPARGGSKRIPRKNIRLFHEKPIVQYSIEAAIESALFDRIVVSTDDPEIASIANELGGETPFVRPAELSDDHTGTNAVVRHAVGWFETTGAPVDEVCCIYATAPFVTASELIDALALLQPDIDFVFTASRFEFPVQRSLVRTASGLVRPMFPDSIGMRSQDLEIALHDAGQFYWGTGRSFALHDIVFLARAVAFELPSHRVQDIDTLEDWTRAEALYRLWKAGA